MAFYGIPTPGLALTASTAGDTIQLFNNSTSVVSANTIIALDGNDIINLGAEGYTASQLSFISGNAGVTGASTGVSGTYYLSGTLFGRDAIYQSGRTINYSGQTPVAFTGTVDVFGVITSEDAVRRIGASQIFGNQGNDSIALGNQLVNLSASTIGGGAGNDVIGTYTYVNNAWTGDKISTASTFISTLIEGGGGNDIINIHTTGSINTTTVQGGAGDDVVTLSAVGNFDAIQLLGGGDADVLKGVANVISGSTIAGGGGDDELDISASGAKKTLFAGDVFNVSDSVYDGADIMQIGFLTGSSISVQGGGGSDSIVFSAAGGTNYLAGNLGNDTIWVKDTVFSASTVYGGAGNDSILFSASLSGSSYIFGGGDKDTINFAFGDLADAVVYNASVYGGLGADKFQASAVVSAGTSIAVTFGYSAYADSTIAGMDSILIGDKSTSGSYVLDFIPAGLTQGNYSGSLSTGTNGVVAFSSTVDSDVSSRYAIINNEMTTVGATVTFKDGSGTNYVFIQGGTSDDLISQVGINGTAVGASTLALVAGRQITINTQ